MKTEKELDDLLLALYWHVEYGEHKKAIEKLKKLYEEGKQDYVDDQDPRRDCDE